MRTKKASTKGKRDIPRKGTATHRVWEEVAAHGPLTRKQVIDRTGIRPALVSSIVQDLIYRGLLDRDDQTRALKLP